MGARISLTDFSSSGVTHLDLTTVHSSLKGFNHGFIAGDHAWFVPYHNGNVNGYVARILLTDFSSTGVTYLDLTTVHPDLKGFVGGFSSGDHAWLVPYNNGAK